MRAKPVNCPIVIPPDHKAIIQIKHIIQDNVFINALNIPNFNKLIEIEQAIPRLIFKRINPTKYIVSVEKATKPFFLIFSESYYPQWKIYINDKPTKFTQIVTEYPKVNVKEAKHDWYEFTLGDVIYYLRKPAVNENSHFIANGYANAWYIDPKEFDKDGDGKFTIVIYFWPQSLFYLGLFISGTTFALCLFYLFYIWYRSKGCEWVKKLYKNNLRYLLAG